MAQEHAPGQSTVTPTFVVGVDWTVPDPTELVPLGASVLVEQARLEQSRYDTTRHELRAHGCCLWKWADGSESGWQLTGHGLNLGVAGASRNVPAELRELLLGLRVGAALKAVSRLRTDRTTHRVVDAAGTVVLELVVDDVTGTEIGECAVITQARQVTVRAESKSVRRRAVRLVEASGGEPGRAIAPLPEPPPEPSGLPANSLTGLVQRYLAAQHDAIVDGDLALRQGHDAVHDSRVAIRRYRTVLHEFGKLFDRERATALDDELSWYAALLGKVRDLEVMRDHLADAVQALAPELVLGSVADDIDQAVAAELQQAQEALARGMRSRRYFALLTELGAWFTAPPFTGRDSPADAVRRQLAKTQQRVANRQAYAAQLDESDPSRDEAAHRVRSAAKQARYTAELAEPALGKAARKSIKRWTQLQSQLGQRQDAVVTAEFLYRLASAAGGTGGPAFTLGILWAQERARIRDG